MHRQNGNGVLTAVAPLNGKPVYPAFASAVCSLGDGWKID
jgi:hypothetical protein